MAIAKPHAPLAWMLRQIERGYAIFSISVSDGRAVLGYVDELERSVAALTAGDSGPPGGTIRVDHEFDSEGAWAASHIREMPKPVIEYDTVQRPLKTNYATLVPEGSEIWDRPPRWKEELTGRATVHPSVKARNVVCSSCGANLQLGWPHLGNCPWGLGYVDAPPPPLDNGFHPRQTFGRAYDKSDDFGQIDIGPDAVLLHETAMSFLGYRRYRKD